MDWSVGCEESEGLWGGVKLELRYLGLRGIGCSSSSGGGVEERRRGFWKKKV